MESSVDASMVISPSRQPTMSDIVPSRSLPKLESDGEHA